MVLGENLMEKPALSSEKGMCQPGKNKLREEKKKKNRKLSDEANVGWDKGLESLCLCLDLVHKLIDSNTV